VAVREFPGELRKTGGWPSALRHGVDAHLNDPVIDQPLVEGLHCHHIFRDAVGHEFFDGAAVRAQPLREMADDLVERNTEPAELRRQAQNLAELPVPADQPHVLVEHGKPLIFGKERDKGIRLNGMNPEVVQLGKGISEERRRVLVNAGEEIFAAKAGQESAT